MNEIISNENMQPGEVREIVNGGSMAMTVRVEFGDGTEVQMSLHPGAEFRLKAGRENSAKVFITGDDAKRSLRLVDDETDSGK
jgi:molybdopterin-binding protein